MSDHTHRRFAWLRSFLLTGLIGAALAFTLPVSADTGAGQNDPGWLPSPPNRAAVNLGRGGRSKAALGLLRATGRLDQWAAGYGMTRLQAEQMFIQDQRAYVDKRGALMFVEHIDNPGTNNPPNTTGLPIPADQVFRLHSRPQSQRKLYLDFNGHVTQGTAWNDSYQRATLISPAFDLDNNPGNFSTDELAVIYGIWQRVKEDYAPFDIDVTTEEPPADQMTRSSASDPTFGMRVVITRDFTPGTSQGACDCGGFAYVGVYGDTSEFYKPAFVFYNNLSGVEKFIAEAVTHEAGHTMGLAHDGQGLLGYYEGHGTGATGWAPIMGVGYSRQLTQWSKGEYTGANNKQDDYLVMQNNGVRFAPDEHGNTTTTATLLTAQTVNGQTVYRAEGVIQGPLDIDMFRINANAGTLSLSLSPDPKDPNLDALVVLRNASGTQIAMANPVDALNATLSVNLPAAGTYFVSVQGTGKGNPASTGYSAYGSIGSYSLQISASPSPTLPPSVTVAASPASGRAPLNVTFSRTVSPNTPGLAFNWDFGDGTASTAATPPAKTYSLPGNYTVTLRVTDAAGMTGTASTTVSVAAAPTTRTMRVTDIAMRGVLVSPSRPDAFARSTVTVRDSTGAPVRNANVAGRWSGVVSSTVSGLTDGNGQIVLSSPTTPFVGTFNFQVTNITAAGFVYNAQSNTLTGRSINF